MATITPQQHLLAGVAAQTADEILADHTDIMGGDLPKVFSTVETVASGENIAALTVVGFDGSGNVVPAVEGTVAAVGVLPYAVDATAGAVGAEIWRSGNFKPEALTWDASYNTDALMQKAFEGAPSPTQIVITPTRTFTAA